MRLIAFFLFSLLVLAWWTPVIGQAEDVPKPDSVILADEQEKYPLGLHLEIVEDPGRELAIEEISSPEFDSQTE